MLKRSHRICLKVCKRFIELLTASVMFLRGASPDGYERVWGNRVKKVWGGSSSD